jgi:hypothetical protein
VRTTWAKLRPRLHRPFFFRWSRDVFPAEIALATMVSHAEVANTDGRYLDLAVDLLCAVDDEDVVTASVAGRTVDGRLASTRAITLSDNVTLLPAGIASAEAFGSITVTVGVATVAPAGIASAEAFGAAVVAEQIITGAGIASAEAFGTLTATPGTTTLVPEGIGSGEAFGIPEVA